MKIDTSPNIEHFILNADTNELFKLREFIDDFCKKNNIKQDISYNIQLVTDEICTNIIKHSYKYDASKKIWLDIFIADKSLIIKISDEGDPFSLLDYQSQNLNDYISHPHKGGLGIPLVKILSDKIKYYPNSSSQKKNTIEIEFFII
jgi:anti-sigma regulatory factor (Ser/Thr protein kinase)